MAFQYSFCQFDCHHLLCIDLLIVTNLNLRVYQLPFAFDLFQFLKSYSLAVKEKIVILDFQIYYYFCCWEKFPHNKPSVLVILSPALQFMNFFSEKFFYCQNSCSEIFDITSTQTWSFCVLELAGFP